jgi:hypothetical protein
MDDDTGQKQKVNRVAADADDDDDNATDEGEGASDVTINVPRENGDSGGHENENEQEQEWLLDDRRGTRRNLETSETTTNTNTNTNRPDAFQIYSDDDTRMLTLLGLDPPANPNEGEQENWRQHVGFMGIGEDRRRRPNVENGATPRRARLSYELHHSAFGRWLELDIGDAPQPRQQPPRQDFLGMMEDLFIGDEVLERQEAEQDNE